MTNQVLIPEPLTQERFKELGVVIELGKHPDIKNINYAHNTLHHYLLALQQTCDFVVLERDGIENFAKNISSIKRL